MQRVFNQKGLSILEVVVALGIFALLISSITAIFLNSLRSKDIVFEQLLTQSQGRRALQDFINELRSASASSIGGYPLAKASANEIIFYSNIDSDNYRERIHYYLSGKNLVKGVLKPSGNPLRYVDADESISAVAVSISNGSPLFYYFGKDYAGNGAPLENPKVTDVRIVQIKFQLERDPNLSPAALNLQGSAEIRNLKSN